MPVEWPLTFLTAWLLGVFDGFLFEERRGLPLLRSPQPFDFLSQSGILPLQLTHQPDQLFLA